MNKIECLGCHNNEPVSVDMVCSPECRRKVYELKECSLCKDLYTPHSEGWLVPEYKSYLDREYMCPNCLAAYQINPKNRKRAEDPKGKLEKKQKSLK
jgi:hypothetical protein